MFVSNIDFVKSTVFPTGTRFSISSCLSSSLSFTGQDVYKHIFKTDQNFSLQGHLNTYRFCDNVWTFVLNNVEFREVGEIVKVDKVKVVACDGKGDASVPGKVKS